MSKVKMRCGRCGKAFTAPKGAKQIFCAECAAKERAARAAAKSTPTQPTATSAAPAPKISGPGAGILDPRLAVAAAASAPPEAGPYGAAARHAERSAERGTDQSSEHGRHGHEHGHTHREDSTHGHEHAQKPRPSAPPQAKRPRGEGHQRTAAPRKPREVAPAFTLTDEMRAKIEARYLELAQPVEFDGIRSQIATELGQPKAVVKRAVRELRDRMQLPSWWDLKAYRGSDADLDRIRAAYLPLLPVPPVGVHKQLAADLRLEPVVVYQGVRRIRAEMRLPQFNPPDAHASDSLPGGARPSNGHDREAQQSAATSSSAGGTLGAS
jgi:hypothetical protein